MHPSEICASCSRKQGEIQKILCSAPSSEKKYEEIIAWGRTLPPYPSSQMTEEHLVEGCQSLLYLHAELKGGKVYYYVHTDALIARGLAAILLRIYENESPESVIRCPPMVFKESGLFDLLSLNRANGIKGLYQRMQREAIRFLQIGDQ